LRCYGKRRYEMGLLDDALKGTVLTGLAIGIGAAVVAPAVLPVLAGVAKPLAKAAMKSGLLLYNRGKEIATEVEEMAEDLWAETKAEAEAEIEAGAEPEIEEGETTTTIVQTQAETGVKAS
jgi:hypothetical protein